MSTSVDQRKSVRVIAYNAKNAGVLKTANISTAAPADKHQSKEHLQLTAAQATVQAHATLMASPTVDKTLPTVYINGYSAPN